MRHTNLKSRLRKLRAPELSDDTAEAETSGTDMLSKRLRRLARARPRQASVQPPMSDEALASTLNGEVTAPGLVEIERDAALSSERALSIDQTLACGLPDLPDPLPGAWAFMDTETTGLAGGSGTLVFLLGLARVAGDKLRLRQFLLTRFGGEAAMLTRAQAWTGDAAFVSYNGRSFDAPLLSTRCRMSGVDDWIGARAHLDLLHGTRRAFARSWPDCRLATVEQRLLGISRSDDLPGSEAPAAWLAHVQGGDASRLAGVLRHNRQDLISLAELLPRLVDAHSHPEKMDADPASIAAVWLNRGEASRAKVVLERNRRRLSQRGLLLLARLYKGAGDWRAACPIWTGLAQHDVAPAIEQLAMFHEHVAHDADTAQHWAQRLPAGQARDRRLARLARKLPQSLVLGFGESASGNSI